MNVNLLVGELQNDYYTYKGCLYPDQSTLSGEDFELALQQSVAICFPQAERKGCLFHFAQAIWSKVQGLGLQVLYKEDKFSEPCESLPHSTFLRVAWRN